jgi:peptide/nickel transport system permease protein
MSVARGTVVSPWAKLASTLGRIVNNYLLRRLVKAFFTIFFVTSLTFFVIRLMPSNPVQIYIQQLIAQYGMAYDEAKNQASAMFAIDLNAPLYEQYFDYLSHLSRGDLGQSLVSVGTPVVKIILKFLPWTIFSVGTALLISFTLGIALGILMAYKRDSLLDNVLTTFGSIMSSVPNYLVAIIIVVLAGVQWHWFSVSAVRGSMSPGVQPGLSWLFIKDIFFHAALPIFTYIITTIGSWMLTMKSSTISTLEEDYVTVARARGLSDARITTAYVGRNASLPLFTQLAISTGFIVGGSVLIEFVFVYQGIGMQLLASVNSRDYSVMQGIFLIITTAVVMANLLADFLYSWLDPRIRIKGGE